MWKNLLKTEEKNIVKGYMLWKVCLQKRIIASVSGEDHKLEEEEKFNVIERPTNFIDF